MTVSTDPVIVDSTTTLKVPATAKSGTAVDLTATVAPVGATGTVQFKDGTDNIGNAVPVNNGTATLKHTFTADGAHSSRNSSTPRLDAKKRSPTSGPRSSDIAS